MKGPCSPVKAQKLNYSLVMGLTVVISDNTLCVVRLSLLPLPRAGAVGVLLAPTIVCHKLCEKLGKSTQRTPALQNAYAVISVFDSDTVPFASPASGAA